MVQAVEVEPFLRHNLELLCLLRGGYHRAQTLRDVQLTAQPLPPAYVVDLTLDALTYNSAEFLWVLLARSCSSVDQLLVDVATVTLRLPQYLCNMLGVC